MKLLLFQAKQFYWKSFSKTLDTVPDQDVTETVTEAVIVFLHAEAEDEAKPGLETKVVKNIKWLANKRQLKNIVLHSFTHLSSSTASPEFAQALLTGLEQRLRGAGYKVWQTPFGYFCEWDLAVYGDSLAKVFKEL
ncbi:MAG: threonyl-tRNA synthetase editing domain-containing protein [Anaerolineae bacterium]|nr:threonyl-tRNA synthetase editing domain-containing protein [Anaerolineae bacterium]